MNINKKTLVKILTATVFITGIFSVFEIRNVKAQDEGQLTDTQRLQRGVDEINAQKDDLAEIIRNSIPPGKIDERPIESSKRQNEPAIRQGNTVGNSFSGEFVPLAGIPGVIDADAAQNPSKFFNGMFMFGISIAAFLAVLMIAIGGIQYMSTDAVSGKTEGKERIQYAVMGLLLVLFSWILLKQINPEILNFNF